MIAVSIPVVLIPSASTVKYFSPSAILALITLFVTSIPLPAVYVSINLLKSTGIASLPEAVLNVNTNVLALSPSPQVTLSNIPSATNSDASIEVRTAGLPSTTLLRSTNLIFVSSYLKSRFTCLSLILSPVPIEAIVAALPLKATPSSLTAASMFPETASNLVYISLVIKPTSLSAETTGIFNLSFSPPESIVPSTLFNTNVAPVVLPVVNSKLPATLL